MELIYFILCAYGMTQILVYGTIFRNIRPRHHFFHCPMCMGFWSGIFLFGINRYTELFTFEYSLANALIMGCLSSGTCYLMSVLINDFGFKITYKDEGDCYVD